MKKTLMEIILSFGKILLLQCRSRCESKIDDVKQDWFTKDMIDNFFAQARSSYAEGLASLYTYERQIPEIAETKIQGLKKFYGVNTKEGLEFFEAHKSADVVHRAECEKLSR